MKKPIHATSKLMTQLLITTILIGCSPEPTSNDDTASIFLGSGGKAGEVTDTSAIVLARLTSRDSQTKDLLVPGAEGQARILYSIDPDFKNSKSSDWFDALEYTDYAAQIELSGLAPKTRQYYKVEMRSDESSKVFTSSRKSFKTAPAADDDAAVHFQVTTSNTYDVGPSYLTMLEQNPDFMVSTGDTVYYDKHKLEWLARTPKQAYNQYQRMYGMPELKAYFDDTVGYFVKDDHDYRFNDADGVMKGLWLGERFFNPKTAKVTATKGNRNYDEAWLNHEDGIRVFRDVFPASEKNYRTFRWGKGVQIWILEGRDFRSPNDMPDGPEKTIWGAEQKAWLKSTLKESDAEYRLVISPTPIVGPDRDSKNDNHVNSRGFYHEGQEFLNFLIDEGMADNTFLLVGDRHWQYHSKYKELIHEFSSSVPGQGNLAKTTADETAHVVRDYAKSAPGWLDVKYTPGGKLDVTITHIYNKPAFSLQFQK